MNRKLKKWIKQLNFKRIGKTAFGELNGYLLSLHQGEYMNECILSVEGFFLDERQKIQMGQMLHNPYVMKENGFDGIILNQNYISIQFHSSKKGIEKMKRFLSWMIPALYSVNFVGSSVCSCCRNPFQGESAEYVLVEDRVCKVHGACMKQMCAPEIVSDSNVCEKSYGKGIFCSLLFGMIGALPAIYLYIFSWDFNIFVMAIVFGAYKGYEFSKAKRNKIAAWIIGICSILCFIISYMIGNQLNILIGVSNKLNHALSISYSAFMLLFMVFFCRRDILDISNRKKIKHIDKNRYDKK